MGVLHFPLHFFRNVCFSQRYMRHSGTVVKPPGHDSVKLCDLKIVPRLVTLASPICKMKMVRQVWKRPKSLAKRYCPSEIGLRGAVDLRFIPVDIVIPGSLQEQPFCSFCGSQGRVINTGAHQWMQKKRLWLNFPSGNSASHALTVLRLPAHLAK